MPATRGQFLQRVQRPHLRLPERVHPEPAQLGHVGAAAQRLAEVAREGERPGHDPQRGVVALAMGAAIAGSALAQTSTQKALIDAAIDLKADMLLVHHGYFWKGEPAPLTGIKKSRIKALLDHDISLVAYHLPLDVHAEVGNNVQLARLLGWQIRGGLEPGNPRSVGLHGELGTAQSPLELIASLEGALGRTPLHISGNDRPIKRIAWCTGAAQGYIEKAIALGMDAFVTGEVSEPTVHSARENGIHFFAAGHHATERYGVLRPLPPYPAKPS